MNVWISKEVGIPPDNYGLFLTDGTDWFEYKPEMYNLPNGTIEHMAADSNNRLWLSILNVGICCFDGQSIRIYGYGESSFPLKDMVITDLYIDKSDRVWVATMMHGIYRLFNDTWEQVIVGKEDILCDHVLTFGTDWKKSTWLACVNENETQFWANSDSWQMVCSLPLGLKHTDEVVCFVVDQNEHIWVGRREGGVMMWNGKSWNRLTKYDCAILYGEIKSLNIDNFNNLWVGTPGGVAIFDGTRWHNWGAIRPKFTQQSFSRDELLQNGSRVETDVVYIGDYIAIDSFNRKWISAPTGIVMFASQ
jgi:ligand-binding sensor domain-containing protein